MGKKNAEDSQKKTCLPLFHKYKNTGKTFVDVHSPTKAVIMKKKVCSICGNEKWVKA